MNQICDFCKDAIHDKDEAVVARCRHFHKKTIFFDNDFSKEFHRKCYDLLMSHALVYLHFQELKAKEEK